MSLMRNFDKSTENSVPLDRSEIDGVSDRVESEERDDGNGIGVSSELLDSATPHVFGELPPEALNCIQRLESELTNVKEVSICSVNFLSLFISTITSAFLRIELEWSKILAWTACFLVLKARQSSKF